MEPLHGPAHMIDLRIWHLWAARLREDIEKAVHTLQLYLELTE